MASADVDQGCSDAEAATRGAGTEPQNALWRQWDSRELREGTTDSRKGQRSKGKDEDRMDGSGGGKWGTRSREACCSLPSNSLHSF